MAGKSEAELNDRTREILRLIIRSYVNSGEPVGSRTLAKSMDWRLSPATIRNIMADLEDEGYLEQPYTSAGRIPSERGYRFYVDHLAESGKVSKSDERYINRLLAESDTPEELMARASLILSTISKNVGLVIAPPAAATVLKHIEFVDLSDGKILVVFVYKTGLLQRKSLVDGTDVFQGFRYLLLSFAAARWYAVARATLAERPVAELDDLRQGIRTVEKGLGHAVGLRTGPTQRVVRFLFGRVGSPATMIHNYYTAGKVI